MNPYFVDVHTHLTHDQFTMDLEAVINRAVEAGLRAIVVNGLEPRSNRTILELAQKHSVIKPALGIYPIDAVHDMLPADFAFDVPSFSIAEEIQFIREKAVKGEILAIGECGLDGHWLSSETFARQEQVFEELLDIAYTCNIPAIIHSRNLELRTFEILRSLGLKKVNMHCYGGKTKWAIKAAEQDGFWFSIPANANVSQSFQKLLKTLPQDKILTETDAPYLGPIKGKRNEPMNVISTVNLLAELRGIGPQEAKTLVFENYLDLFERK